MHSKYKFVYWKRADKKAKTNNNKTPPPQKKNNLKKCCITFTSMPESFMYLENKENFKNIIEQITQPLCQID